MVLFFEDARLRTKFDTDVHNPVKSWRAFLT